ncbi:hypothetical protein, partial [Oceanithermus sp.]
PARLLFVIPAFVRHSSQAGQTGFSFQLGAVFVALSLLLRHSSKAGFCFRLGAVGITRSLLLRHSNQAAGKGNPQSVALKDLLAGR